MDMDEGRVLAPANWAPRAPVPGPAFPSTGPQSQPSPTPAKGSRGRAVRPGFPTHGFLAPSLPSHQAGALIAPLCARGHGDSERLTLCSGARCPQVAAGV